jgi:dihydrofolate reductase
VIVAVAENGVIGRAGKLPWHLPEDLRRFKRLTMGHTIIMGRRTWESIARPLPGRRMIVVSRRPGYKTGTEGVEAAGNLDDALRIASASGEEEAFVIGGAELYRESLQRAERIHLTFIHAEVEGDTYFPQVDFPFIQSPYDWVLIESHKHEADAENEYPFTFCVWQHCEPQYRNS